MKGEKGVKPRRFGKTIIPDYNHLFDENETGKGVKKYHLLSKLAKMNVLSLILTTLIYIVQVAPKFIFSIASANIINIVTDALSSSAGFTSQDLNGIILNTVIFAISLILHVPCTMLRYGMVSKIMRNTSAGIKSAVVRKLQSLSITYQKDMQVGKIQSKFLKDVEATDNLFRLLLLEFITTVINTIIAIVISIYNNGYVALFFLVAVPFNVGLTFVFRKSIRRKNHDYRVKLENMSAKLSTMLEMMAVTKAHGLEETEITSTEKYINELKGSGIDLDKTTAGFGSASFALNLFLQGACLLFCAFLAVKGVIKVGDIVLYQSLFSSLSAYISALVNLTPQISSGFESLNSLGEIMNVKDVEINIGKKCCENINGDVEFKNVYYRYPKSQPYVLKNVSFKVNAGECIAVVGASGSGKSTIMNMVIGFLRASSGKVLIDEKPIEEYDISEYRHNLSVVPQNSILFAGTIKENITYGLDKYSEKDLNRVVEMANITEFISELPDGLNTYIGEHGDKLSGGQKQRITIARALIRNPKILILDEATSALDNISEFHVQKAISQSIEGRTTFIVAHRLSTIRDADRIIVMENGLIAECGTYDELMAKRGKFYQLKKMNDINLKNAEAGLN